jgi:flagellar motor switch protein FliN/FliY
MTDQGFPEPPAAPAPVPGVAGPEAVPVAAAGGEAPSGVLKSMEMLHGVEMAVTVELGRTRMSVRDLLRLTQGSVVELDKAAGAPVDILVNGTAVARGEVVVVDDEYGVRVSEVVGRAQDRLATGG